jgi:alkyl hydroperoxide reductase subunit AhpF
MRRGSISVEDYLGVPGVRVAVVEHTDSSEPAPVLARIAALAPWLVVTTLSRDEGENPGVSIAGTEHRGSVRFIGPLEGRQLEPFVELLRALATGEIEWETPATPARLRDITRPLGATIAVSATCPYCPAVSAALLRCTLATPKLSVLVARADLGFAVGVTSVPTVLVDGEVLARGPIGEYQLADALAAH